MNEDLDLVEILKDCPKGTKLYSTIHGEVTFSYVISNEDVDYPINVICDNDEYASFTRYGKYDLKYDGECVLFPSKDQRDWGKFEIPVQEFDYSTLQPFDKVLVRDGNCQCWRCAFFSCMLSNGMLCECRWEQGIPYNDKTKHLIGTTDRPDEKYIWWEEYEN